jgi:hypothetical protein
VGDEGAYPELRGERESLLVVKFGLSDIKESKVQPLLVVFEDLQWIDSGFMMVDTARRAPVSAGAAQTVHPVAQRPDLPAT